MDISLARFVKAEITRALGRFESQLTRVEVHLSDVNSHKPGPYDKRCQIEARPAGRKPVSVSIEAETVAWLCKCGHRWHTFDTDMARVLPAVEPMSLARLREPFSDPDWLFELKHDGFRALAYVENGTCRLVSRNGNVSGASPANMISKALWRSASCCRM